MTARANSGVKAGRGLFRALGFGLRNNVDWLALRRFSAMIGLFMALLVSAVSLVFGHYEVVNNRKSFDAEVYEFSSVARQHLRAFEYVAIRSTADVFLQTNNIRQLYVEDAYGYAIFGTRDSFDRLPYDEIVLTDTPEDGRHELGRIWISYRGDGLSMILLRSGLIGLAGFLLAWVSARGLMYHYIKRFVAQPIAEITTAMTETVATGKLVQSSYSGDTQLGRLAASFNDMQAHLQQARGSLQASLDALHQEKHERQFQLRSLGNVLHATGQHVSFYTSQGVLRHSTAGADTNPVIRSFLRQELLCLDDPAGFFAGTDFDAATVEVDEFDAHETRFKLEVENWEHGIWTFSCLQLATGEYALTCTDVTAARKSERNLIHRQKMDAVGELTSGIAHEIKNVLAIISGSLELSMGQIDDNHAVTDHLTTAKTGCDRASSVIGKLLNFSRQSDMSEDTQELLPNLQSLQSMIQNLLGPHIDFDIDVEPGLFLALDWQKLESVLVNLVINARDAINARAHVSHSGKVTISARHAPIDRLQDAQLPLGKAHVMLSIADDGCGMKAAVRNRIFEPFFSTKKRGQGTGLGLSEVYGFVKQCDGHIMCQSEPGIGTLFQILLPLAQASARGRSDPAVVPITGKLRSANCGGLCLVVDDEAALVEIIRRALESRGNRVITAGTLRDARAALAAHGAGLDFLLCDYYLTDGIGTDLLKIAAETHPDLDCALMTGNISEVDKSTAHCKYFLDKPFALSELFEILALIKGHDMEGYRMSRKH